MLGWYETGPPKKKTSGETPYIKKLKIYIYVYIVLFKIRHYIARKT